MTVAIAYNRGTRTLWKPPEPVWESVFSLEQVTQATIEVFTLLVFLRQCSFGRMLQITTTHPWTRSPIISPWNECEVRWISQESLCST